MPVSRLVYLLIVPVFVWTLGCKSLGVEPVNPRIWLERQQQTSLTSNRPSPTVEQFLRRHDWDKEFKRNPEAVLGHLVEALRVKPTRPTAFVLAELCYLRAKQQSNKADEAAKLYCTAVQSAYAALFDESLGDPPNIYGPHFRMACDLYNYSLAQLVRYHQQPGRLWKDPTIVPSLLGPVEFSLARNGLPWTPTFYIGTPVAYDFRVIGLSNVFKTHGLGVPLICLHETQPPDMAPVGERFLQRHVPSVHPGTVFVRFDSPLTIGHDTQSGRRGLVEVYDSMKERQVVVGDQRVILETDLTTPLAYLLDTIPQIEGLEMMFKSETYSAQCGLYTLHPYQPGKIPIVFVHGLMSKPATWLQMLNDLMGDPEIREHYQFWLFMYPTGNPILYSAQLLREHVMEVRTTLDPDGNDPALDNMVLIGHSMGGVMSRIAVSRSGDEVWESVSDVSLDELDLTPQERELIRNVMFFEPLPCVGRALFLAAPHRGSSLAEMGVAKLAAGAIGVSAAALGAGGNLITQLGQKESNADRIMKRVPTSLDNLSPDSPLSKAMTLIQIDSAIPYHSIIGNHKAADTPGGTDTTVPYESAHLDGAESEKIVKSKHMVNRHPLAILEVRRILMEHLTNSGPHGGRDVRGPQVEVSLNKSRFAVTSTKPGV